MAIPKLRDSFRRYDWNHTYQWNYDNAPELPERYEVHRAGRNWELCGISVNSPVGIAAGPLLNGRWVLHYASIGYDVLTYKTVRSRAWPCYPPPNLQPVSAKELLGPPATPLSTSEHMDRSWAVSFGMPSQSPDIWRQDVLQTRRLLPAAKRLAVSVVATPENEWTIDQVANDYAQCAYWARESGADFIELNFSCPNVATCDGQLFHSAKLAQHVTQCVRDRIDGTPLLIKIGFLDDRRQIDALVQAVSGLADGLVMINCIPARVEHQGQALFDGQPRGIAGPAIRRAVFGQIAQFHQAIAKASSALQLVAVGGIADSETVEQFLSIGAAGVQIATHAMLADACRSPETGNHQRELGSGQ